MRWLGALRSTRPHCVLLEGDSKRWPSWKALDATDPREQEDKETSKKSLLAPLPEGHPVDRDSFFCLKLGLRFDDFLNAEDL